MKLDALRAADSRHEAEPAVHGGVAAVRAESDTATTAPRVLVLTGAKRGDNAQLRMLAEHLGLPYREIALGFNALHVLPNALLPNCPFNLRSATRRTLVELGPVDVVLSIGKRSYRAARALKRRNGGATRWIHLGRPWGAMDAIDLLITTPQYGMRPQAKVLVLPTPIPTVNLAAPMSREHADSPALCAVLLGGDSTSHHMRSGDFQSLLAAARREAARHAARLLVVASRRTPAAIRAALNALHGDDIVASQEHSGALDYVDILRRADAFIVTSDSASMLGEALMTGKPVYVFHTRERYIARLLGALDKHWAMMPALSGLRRLREFVIQRGWWVPPRNMDALLASLRGLAVHELDEPQACAWHAPATPTSPALTQAVDAVLHLINAPGYSQEVGANDDRARLAALTNIELSRTLRAHATPSAH